MPFPNNHACLLDGSLKVVGSQTRDHNGKRYIVRIGKKAGKSGSAERSYLYPKNEWTESAARAHCKSHGGTFEPASAQTQETMEPNRVDPKENPVIRTGDEEGL